MKAINSQQIIIIHSLLPDAVKKDKEMKAQLISQYTGRNDKTSTRDLSYFQAKELIQKLQAAKNKTSINERADKMRKKIISMAHDLGWQIFCDKKQKLIADMKAINTWCVNYGLYHKKLETHSYTELPQLVSQFETMYKERMSKK